jgi:hypothetical protein
MEFFATRELEHNYGLSAFNTNFGESIVESEDPNTLYVLAETTIGVYESQDYNQMDLVHPFRPSGDEYVIEVDNSNPSMPSLFYEANIDSLERLDRDLMSRIENRDSGDYYKQIL